jgi:inner membrane protein
MNLSLVVKTLVVAALSLALYITVLMIQNLVAERQARRNEAVAGIAEGWGRQQTVAGPWLAIPYERQWTEVRQEMIDGRQHETRVERQESRVLTLPAKEVRWTVDAEVSEKMRGIYKARLYGARILARGSLELPPRGRYEDATSRYRWGTPRLVVGVSDPGGIRAAGDLLIDGKAAAFSAGTLDPVTRGGLHVPIEGTNPAQRETLPFSFTLELGGLENFSIAPLGADTSVVMSANWPHPSFQGRFLPAHHEITREGFSAEWKVSRLAAQGAASSGPADCAFPCNRMHEQVSVWLVEPAGLYQRLERASKYGFLFIGLTFAGCLLIELLRRLAIHPVQYLLVGLALAMFFLLLTALSEHIAFGKAYAIATAACVALITVYLVRVLGSTKLGLAFGAALAGLYCLLYALLKAEDYSLLGGAILLFALLAAVMLATRSVDWYRLTAKAAA